MLQVTLKKKIDAKLKRNKKQNIKPCSYCELAEELGFSRQVFYTKKLTPLAMGKLKGWVENNEKCN